jgi:ADP-ribosylglycohydrolase
MGVTPDLARARQSLDGLSVGDAFGERMFSILWLPEHPASLPPGPWKWTDDTHMALSIVEVLETFGRIDQDALASAFARRFVEEPKRGYGGGAIRLLMDLHAGTPWRIAAPALFGGGSYGNGAAMRAAPIGACFWRDPAVAVEEARKSAVITHAHIEGQAGAMAVAVAAAIAAQPDPPSGADFLRATLPFIPESVTRERIAASLALPGVRLREAAEQLGVGEKVSAQDTVPFCLWCAAYHLHDFPAAMWWTVRESADQDTTCAIVGGIVASATGIPDDWLRRREPLPIGNS